MARLTESEYRAEIKRLKARVNKFVAQHNEIERRLADVGIIVEDNQLADAVRSLIDTLNDAKNNADPHGLVAEQAQVFDRMREHLRQVGFNDADVEEAVVDLCKTYAAFVNARNMEHAELDQAAISGTQGLCISTLPEAVVERLNVLAKAAARNRTLTQAAPEPETPVCHHTETVNNTHVSIAYSGKFTERQQSIISIGFSLITTLLRKNRDYGNSSSKPPVLAPTLSPDAAVRVRMSDKIERIISLSSPENGGPAVKNESLQDTYLDLAGYCILQTINLHDAEQS